MKIRAKEKNLAKVIVKQKERSETFDCEYVQGKLTGRTSAAVFIHSVFHQLNSSLYQMSLYMCLCKCKW